MKNENKCYHAPDVDLVSMRMETSVMSQLDATPTQTEGLGDETAFDSLW